MARETNSSTNSSMRSLERAFEVLGVIEGHGATIRLTDLSHKTGLHVSTVTRILNVLVRRGYVEQDEAGRYRLGPLFLTGSHAYLQTDLRNRLARPIIQDLASTTGLTASFYVQHESARVLTVRVDGERPLDYQIPLGQSLPLHVGGGKVIAAMMSDDEIKRLIDDETGISHADGTRKSRDEFMNDIMQIRRNRYWHAIGERIQHVESLAAPVKPMHAHQRPGAVVLATDTDTTNQHDRITRFSGELLRAVRAIEELAG